MKTKFFVFTLLCTLMLGSMVSCELLEEDVTKFTVTFDGKGGTPASQQQSVKEGDKATKPADPTREGYGFAGWTKTDSQTGALWNFETETVTMDITLYAQWSVSMHLVTFDSNGGTAVESKTIAHGNTVAKPKDPTRGNDEFDGWFNGDTEWSFANVITAPITLKAKWTALYNVTFDSDGGSDVAAQTIREGDAAEKPADPTREGFEFDGWFNGNTEWNFANAITAHLTLKAKWTAAHTVIFDTGIGGTVVADQIIRSGEKATQPEDPTREFRLTSGLYLGTIDLDIFPSHHIFIEWRKEGDDKAYDFNTPITAPITIKAFWDAPTVTQTPIESVLANDISAAVNYVKANSYTGEEYTLLLGANVTAGIQNLNMDNAKLTIMSNGAERTITSTDRYQLFTIDGNNATSLTIGRNITLTNTTGGDYVYISEGNRLVRVLRGSLTMRDGAKITKARNGAVYVSGLYANFRMEGGEISGNNITSSYISSGVFVTGGGTFEMSGSSSMTGNVVGTSDIEDIYINHGCTFRLSGGARIGTLILNANNADTRAVVNINGTYSGTVNSLHLRGNNSAVSNVAIWWTNVPVIINGTASINSMFNNSLGDFRPTGNSFLPISVTHQLNAAGLLVPREY